MSDEEVRYYRLASLLFDTNGSVLQEYLKHLLSTGAYSSLQNMLSMEQHNLFHNFWKPRLDCMSCTPCGFKGDKRTNPVLNNTQWTNLYGPNPSDTCSNNARPCQYCPNPHLREEDLDITLITFLLLNIFSGLNANVFQAVNDLRSARNDLCHSSRASLDDKKFNAIWSKVEHAILLICSEIGPVKRTDVQAEIIKLKSRDMDADSSTRLMRTLKDSMTEVGEALLYLYLVPTVDLYIYSSVLSCDAYSQSA